VVNRYTTTKTRLGLSFPQNNKLACGRMGTAFFFLIVHWRLSGRTNNIAIATVCLLAQWKKRKKHVVDQRHRPE